MDDDPTVLTVISSNEVNPGMTQQVQCRHAAVLQVMGIFYSG